MKRTRRKSMGDSQYGMPQRTTKLYPDLSDSEVWNRYRVKELPEQEEQPIVQKDEYQEKIIESRAAEEEELGQDLFDPKTSHELSEISEYHEDDMEEESREEQEKELENFASTHPDDFDMTFLESKGCQEECNDEQETERSHYEEELANFLEDDSQINTIMGEISFDNLQREDPEDREKEEHELTEWVENLVIEKENVNVSVVSVNGRGAYECAMELLSEKDFRYLDSPNESDQLVVFNGRYWEAVDDKRLDSIIYDFLTPQERKEKDNISRYCGFVRNHLKFECYRRYEKRIQRFSESDFLKIDNRVVFQNCVYDVKKGKKYEFDNSLPYYMGICTDYTDADGETPMYDKLKRDATGGDADSMDMIDLMIAYLVIPNQSAKCFFIMSYAKDSGKSVLGHFIENLFEDGRIKTIDPSHLGSRFAFAGVENIVLMSCLEMSTDRLSKEEVAQFKKITGEKRIRSERKYGNEKTIPIRFKLLVASNGGLLLPAQMQDDAFYRRCIVIPFVKSTPVDCLMSNLPERLEQEKPYIISKAVRKLKDYFDAEGGGIRFPESRLSKQIKYSWSNQAHLEYEFIDLYLKYTGNLDDGIWKEDIFKLYQEFYMEKSSGCTNLTMLTSNDLMRVIQNKFPGVQSKKMRRCGRNSDEKKNKPCLTCLQWK